MLLPKRIDIVGYFGFLLSFSLAVVLLAHLFFGGFDWMSFLQAGGLVLLLLVVGGQLQLWLGWQNKGFVGPRRLPSLVKRLLTGVGLFGQKIEAVFSWLLLMIVYIFGVGTTALIARMVGKNFLAIDFKSAEDSYWRPTSSKVSSDKDYLHQY